MRTAIVIGSNSDIAKHLTERLRGDGWEVFGWKRGDRVPKIDWDVCLFAVGKVAPVGNWWDVLPVEWEDAIESNLLLPFRMLNYLWPYRRQGATVCFMAGSNPQRVMPGYSAYNAGKMALNKLTEQLDAETPDAKFVALNPGYHTTKIHDATKAAGWPNDVIDSGRPGGDLDDVYRALLWCIEQPKSVVGGRNICVSDLKYEPSNLAGELEANPEMFKLRRVE